MKNAFNNDVKKALIEKKETLDELKESMNRIFRKSGKDPNVVQFAKFNNVESAMDRILNMRENKGNENG